MKSTKLTNESVELLAQYLGDQIEAGDAPPPPKGKPVLRGREGWQPDLNHTQRLIFDDAANNILGASEKGSGKTLAFAHKAVRHAYENHNALVLLITPTIRTGNEGIWYELETLVLPHWSEGIGLEFRNSALDPLTKDRHRWIRNRHGGWSKLLLMSIPHASMVEARAAGMSPSMIYVDELDKCDGIQYWTFLSGQLGRRKGITGPQQFCASCNPKGPSHWVYKVFFENCINPDTGVRKPNFSVYHVPIQENLHRLPAGYLERQHSIWANDEIMWKRLVEGIWVDVPTGDAIFRMQYRADIHIKGDAAKGTGLQPRPGYPVYIGYDIGQVWQGITFLQCIPTAVKNIWIIFDECDHLDEKVIYKVLAWEVIERMRYWRRRINYPLIYQHITDDSAINQFRPGGEGGYDAWEFEREFNKVLAEFGAIGADGKVEPAKMLGCPKGPGSIAARVRTIQNKLINQELFIGAQCGNTTECCRQLERDPKDPVVPKRSKYIHKFDSFSYPIFKVEVGGDPRLHLPVMPQPSVRLIRLG